MVFGVYLLPVVACLLLHFGFDYRGEWIAYLWIIIFGEATVAGAHIFFYHQYVYFTEYLGSIVESIHFEEDWVELVEYTETRTDSNGKSYQVKKIKERYHPEKYYFITTLGTRFSCGWSYYSYVRNLWQLPEHRDSWRGNHIKGGIRRGLSYFLYDFTSSEVEDIKNWVPVTEARKYKNKVRCSNSIMKYENIGREKATEMGLMDYPAIVNFDAPCILSNDKSVPPKIDEYFRCYNARIAPQWQMRLYIILFDANRGIGITEHQRNYWQGGNKNEFVICIGLDARNHIEWARAFSWADVQQKEVETA